MVLWCLLSIVSTYRHSLRGDCIRLMRLSSSRFTASSNCCILTLSLRSVSRYSGSSTTFIYTPLFLRWFPDEGSKIGAGEFELLEITSDNNTAPIVVPIVVLCAKMELDLGIFCSWSFFDRRAYERYIPVLNIPGCGVKRSGVHSNALITDGEHCRWIHREYLAITGLPGDCLGLL